MLSGLVGRIGLGALFALASALHGSIVGPVSAQPEPRGPVVENLIQTATLPVYGPTGNPFRLRLLTVASGAGAGGRVAGVQLLFADFQPDGTRVALSVRSFLPQPDQPTAPPADAEAVLTGYNPYHDIYIDLQLDSRGAPRAYPSGLPELVTRDVEVDGALRSVSLSYWPQDNGFSVYTFSIGDVTVAGGALGLTPDDLVVVLAGLARLNDTPALVSQYDEEYQAHGQTVARLAGAGPRPADDPSLRHRLPIPARTRQSGGISVAAFGGEQQGQRQFLYDIINLSSHFALMVEHSFPFDGGFTLVLPPNTRPRVTFAAGIVCAEGEQPNMLACRMVEDVVQLVFVTEDSSG